MCVSVVFTVSVCRSARAAAAAVSAGGEINLMISYCG